MGHFSAKDRNENVLSSTRLNRPSVSSHQRGKREVGVAAHSPIFLRSERGREGTPKPNLYHLALFIPVSEDCGRMDGRQRLPTLSRACLLGGSSRGRRPRCLSSKLYLGPIISSMMGCLPVKEKRNVIRSTTVVKRLLCGEIGQFQGLGFSMDAPVTSELKVSADGWELGRVARQRRGGD